MAGREQIRVEGARELRREIRKLQDKGLKDELKRANKDAAEIVAEEAKRYHVPVRSGALKRSIRALGSQTRGQVAAGIRRSKVYAPIIHFGNPHRNIKPQPFLYEARDKRIRQVFEQYEDAMNRLHKKISTR